MCFDFLFGALHSSMNNEGRSTSSMSKINCGIHSPNSHLDSGQLRKYYVENSNSKCKNLKPEGSVPCRILSVRLLRGSAGDNAHLLANEFHPNLVMECDKHFLAVMPRDGLRLPQCAWSSIDPSAISYGIVTAVRTTEQAKERILLEFFAMLIAFRFQARRCDASSSHAYLHATLINFRVFSGNMLI